MPVSVKSVTRRNNRVAVRFVTAKISRELALDNPDQEILKVPVDKTSADWSALPLRAGEGVRWSRQTLEARWARECVVRGISLVFFTFRQPNIQVPDVEDIIVSRWDETRRRWVRLPVMFCYDDTRRRCRANYLDSGYIELVCQFADPMPVTLLRVKVGCLPCQCVLHDVRRHARSLPCVDASANSLGCYARGRREYAEFVAQAFPGLAADIDRRPSDGAEDFFQRQLKPYRGRALLGLKDDCVETGVDWDHTVLEERTKGVGHVLGMSLAVAFLPGASPISAGDLVGNSVRRSLSEGWLPCAVTVLRCDGVEYRLTTFVQPPAECGGDSFTRIRCEMVNRTRGERVAELKVIIAALSRMYPRTYSLADMKLRRQGCVIYDAAGQSVVRIAQGGRFHAGFENVVVYKLSLQPGARRVLDFAVARLGASSTGKGTRRVGSFDQGMRLFRRYWRGILSSGTVVQLPDKRLNARWKNFLTQFFITATGDRMPYAAFPSHYDGSVFGIEEGWTMQALASAGYGRDALRYFTNTYLTDAHLSKTNYHHQYRAGYALVYAHSLFRLTHDADWLREHIERLRIEAKWIMGARRRTMRKSGGVRPLHWGLLPYHFYGGDVHKPAYSLHPNAVCWRGLRDFGLMLRAIGDSDDGLYLDDAGAYKRCIDTAIKRTIKRGADETFLSMKLYWDKPYPYNDAFWPLFFSMFIETNVMNPAGADVQGILAWLRRHNKTLAGVPVLYPMRLDPVYGLGIALTRLQAGDIDEYLKTVAAYQVFLTDPAFHTTPESGDLCLRDKDSAWEIRSEDKTWRQWRNPSSPLTAGAAVIFLLIRNMLLTEVRDAEGMTDGRLLIMPACPVAWYASGQRVRVERMATEYGAVSYDFSVVAGKAPYRCRVDFAVSDGCRMVGVRIRPLAGKRNLSVTVNGRRCKMHADRLGTLWLQVEGRELDLTVGEG